MQLKTINDIQDISSKRVLVRADLNVPIEEGVIQDSTRIDEFLPTVDLLLKNKAKQIIIMTHLGRPNGEFNEEFSLTPIYEYLKKKYPSIKFASDFDKLDSSPLILFQNIRFWKEEEKDDEGFAKKLASYGDCYIDDAFSVSHRNHASNYGITKFLPSYAGLLLQREVDALSSILEKPTRPLTFLMGGAKLETKLPLVNALLSKADHILVGGKIAAELTIQDPKIVKAIDYSDETKFDIGPKTVEKFIEIIRESKTLLFNGPLGFFEKKPYDQGTIEVVKEIAKLSREKKLFSVVGGGDTIFALGKYKDDISYCSTAGGAFLEFVEKGMLDAIKVLEKDV